MALFLVLSIPLTILIVTGAYFREESVERGRLKHGLHALLLAVPAVIINIALKKPLPGSFQLKDLIQNVFLYRSFQIFILALFLYHLTFGFQESVRTRKFKASSEWQAFQFFGVYYSMVSIVDSVLMFGDYNAAILFYVPVARIGVIFFVTVLLALVRQEVGIKKVLLFLTVFIVPAVGAAGFPLFYLQKYSVAIPIMAVILGGSFIGFHLWMVKQYEPEMNTNKVSIQAR